MSGEELDATMRAHIEAAAGHFKGQVYSWDVVNEGINNMPHLRRCPLPQWTCSLKTAGSQGSSVDWTLAGNDTVSYVEKAFRYAHAADPDAKLFFNEFDIHGETDKMAVVEAMLMDLLSRGVPVHGVGMQTHIDNSNPNKAFNETGFRNVLKRFAAIGVEIHISELNVKSTNDPIYKDCTTDDCKEKALADLYGQVLSACLDEPLCKSFELWGLTDHHNSLHTGGGSMPIPGAFLYDDWYQPKPVRAKLADILSSRSQFARPIAV
jgi:endo-1,4-beta-xylanase